MINQINAKEPDNGPFTGEHRPDLKPIDPRNTGNPTNDFHIMGSIDNETSYDVDDGTAIRSRF
jgi:hypothetical protein